MNRHAIGACAALVLSGVCCFTGMGAVQLRRWTVAHERAEDEARYRRLEPPPTPLYAIAGKRLYTWAMFLCFGAGGVLLLAGAAWRRRPLTAGRQPRLRGRGSSSSAVRRSSACCSWPCS